MTSKAYVGPTVTARCPACGGYQEVPDPDLPCWGDGPPGACEKCGAHAEKTVWPGPVVPV